MNYQNLSNNPLNKGRIIRASKVTTTNSSVSQSHIEISPNPPSSSSSSFINKNRVNSIDLSSSSLSSNNSNNSNNFQNNKTNIPLNYLNKLNELENENNKLKNKLNENELIILSYKNFLNTKSIINNQNISTQTENYEQENQLNELYEQNKQNNIEINELKIQNNQLNNEVYILKNQINDLINNQTNITKNYELKINTLNKKLQLIKSITNIKKKNLLDCKSNFNQNKDQITLELKLFQTHFHQSFSSILQKISLLSSSSTSSSSSINYSKVNSPNKLISSPITPKKVITPLINTIESGNNPITPIKTVLVHSSTNTERDETQNELNELKLKLQQKDDKIIKCLDYFQLISKAFNELKTTSLNEISSLKHLSHCKELVRIASMRELGLEKDRLTNELKYSMEVKNVFGFCLETAEQMLQDINPSLIIKIRESRHKRLQLLDRDIKERRKDIEQRSLETCTVNTSHLESFQLKAEQKYTKIMEESKRIYNNFEDILNQHNSL